EIASSRAAHAAGLAPELVHAEAGALVLRYVEGRTLAPADIRAPSMLPRLIPLLHRCHREIPKHLRGPAPFFWAYHAIRDYAPRPCAPPRCCAKPCGAWSPSCIRPSISTIPATQKRISSVSRQAGGTSMATELPSSARCVIIGGGIIGCSLAYHLVRLGWKEIL